MFIFFALTLNATATHDNHWLERVAITVLPYNFGFTLLKSKIWLPVPIDFAKAHLKTLYFFDTISQMCHLTEKNPVYVWQRATS